MVRYSYFLSEPKRHEFHTPTLIIASNFIPRKRYGKIISNKKVMETIPRGVPLLDANVPFYLLGHARVKLIVFSKWDRFGKVPGIL